MYSTNVPRPFRYLLLVLTAFAALSLVQLPAQAQTDHGRITGLVTDAN